MGESCTGDRAFVLYGTKVCKIVVPLSQIMATFRVNCYPALQRISFSESLEIHLISDIKIE